MVRVAFRPRKAVKIFDASFKFLSVRQGSDSLRGMNAVPNPYRSGLFAPVEGECREEALDVIAGEVPRDLFGDFVRNGSNPRFEPKGRYHWFDGDGMVHRVRFENGRAHYMRRYVETDGFKAETLEGQALWGSSTERPDFTRKDAPFKNTANTDLAFHNGKLLALWWLSGEVYALDPHTLETLGREEFGAGLRSISAHPKVDPRTGELLYFDYQARGDFLSTGIVSPEGKVSHHTVVPLDGPRLQHDMAFTEHFVLLFDMSMQWDPEELKKGRTKVGLRKGQPGRIGVLRRGAAGETIRWFDAAAFYMYHVIGAYEEGDTIRLVGCRIENPVADPTKAEDVPTIGFLRLEPRLHEWTLDLRTGACHERSLDDALGEFPRMDDRFGGVKFRYAAMPNIARREATLLFDGVDVHDLEKGTKASHRYGEGRFGSEVVFAPRTAAGDEFDGWLVTFVVDRVSDGAEAWVLDAKDVEAGPVARLRVPGRVPVGFHADWVPGWKLPARP
jgi:carotenoid cleavage dioxygenase